jgi:hypothetical protein
VWARELTCLAGADGWRGMRATRRGHVDQEDGDEARAAAGDEFIAIAAVVDEGTTERAAGSEVRCHSS